MFKSRTRILLLVVLEIAIVLAISFVGYTQGIDKWLPKWLPNHDVSKQIFEPRLQLEPVNTVPSERILYWSGYRINHQIAYADGGPTDPFHKPDEYRLTGRVEIGMWLSNRPLDFMRSTAPRMAGSYLNDSMTGRRHYCMGQG